MADPRDFPTEASPLTPRLTPPVSRIPLPSLLLAGLGLAVSALPSACGSPGSDAASRWSGTVDTLPSGEVAVRNPGDPVWEPGEEWRVVEELRIGSVEGDAEDPDIFSYIESLDVDAWGRIFVLDHQAQEVRVFDSEGAFVLKFGGRGEGPGEFDYAVSVGVTRKGEVWVMDMSRDVVSVFDTAGSLLREERAKTGGFVWTPNPGGLDPTGRYNILLQSVVLQSRFKSRTPFFLARFDQSFTPIDTFPLPQDPVERHRFEIDIPGRQARMGMSVPFQGRMEWRFSPAGTLWMLLTGRYELVEITTTGETLRRVTKDHEPMPVTRGEVRKEAEWFTQEGGKIDWSKVPESKAPVVSLFLDDEGNIWVERFVASEEEKGRLFDLFDPEGRFLGTLRLPFSLHRVGQRSRPAPLVRNGVLHAVTKDELDVSFVVRARIEKE